MLYESYVGGGFTAPEIAATSLRAAAVRSRGTVLVAHDEAGDALGTVTLVNADSPARRLASAGEREIHLLCVRPDMRRSGIGRALVQEALSRARTDGASGVVLWTQPTMHAARRSTSEPVSGARSWTRLSASCVLPVAPRSICKSGRATPRGSTSTVRWGTPRTTLSVWANGWRATQRTCDVRPERCESTAAAIEAMSGLKVVTPTTLADVVGLE